MPQGSDFYQREANRERSDRCTAEKLCAEIDQLRMRVRELEDLVAVMAQKLEIKTHNWTFWK